MSDLVADNEDEVFVIEKSQDAVEDDYLGSAVDAAARGERE